MNANPADSRLSAVASAIADPARARMLCSLLDGCARTATELAALAQIAASTASSHFQRMREQGLVELTVQGKHRYYRLANAEVATALEALLVVAGVPRTPFTPSTPPDLCHARTCYDHMAGEVAVELHDALMHRGWLTAHEEGYALTEDGAAFFRGLGLDVGTLQAQRRRFAYPCLDWSARRPHLGGSLGAALLDHLRGQRWVNKDMDSRTLRLTRLGVRQLEALFGVRASGR